MSSAKEGLAEQSERNFFDETDDKLEEFEELGEAPDVAGDPDLQKWQVDWEATGWDEEDMDDDFAVKLKAELERYALSVQNRTDK